MAKSPKHTATPEPAGPASRRYAVLYDKIRALNQIADSNQYPDDDRDDARRAREVLMIEAGQIFDDVLEENRALFRSEPVIIEHGLAMLVSKVLVELRTQIEREMERNDLTPYMWSSLSTKRDALAKVFRMLEGRPLRKIHDWVVPEYLLLAEFDDDSVDFKEALDADEADALTEDFIERGAVVTRYATYQETGDKSILFYPVLPHENNHRTMTQRQYNWTLRTKGAENLTLPENPDEFMVKRFGPGPDRDDDAE